MLGSTDDDSAFSIFENVTLLGKYDESEFLEIIDKLSPDLTFFPSVYPETYSYMLSKMMVAGVYPVVFDLGAMAHRIRSLDWGRILPMSLVTSSSAIVNALLLTYSTPPSQGIFDLAHGREYPDILRDYYNLSWRCTISESVTIGSNVRLVEQAELRCVRFTPPRREATLFVTHSSDGRLKPHVQRYASSWAEAGIDVYLIIAADLPSQTGEFEDVCDVCGIFVRHNEGYDFAAWAHIIRGYPEFKTLDILFLTNDSIFGPLDNKQFMSLIVRVRDGDASIYGLTENFEKGWHLQSYFLAVKQPALGSQAFDKFFESVVSWPDKEQVIDNYEISFAMIMEHAGFRSEALFSIASERNQTLRFWKELLACGFPFVKIQACRDILPGVDRNEAREFLRRTGFSADELEPLFKERST
jgi:hypothetical protein